MAWNHNQLFEHGCTNISAERIKMSFVDSCSLQLVCDTTVPFKGKLIDFPFEMGKKGYVCVYGECFER
jgi:hypothetical protein